jgi:hypothetical protein
MKIKIDCFGHLKIKRGNKFKEVECPRNDNVCGNHCALFGEPENYGIDSVLLGLCSKVLTISKQDFTDERIQSDEN